MTEGVVQPLRTTTVSVLRTELVSSVFVELIPRDFARAHLILSQGRDNGTEQLAIAESTPPAAVFNVGVRLGIDVEPVLADAEAIARAIDEAYGQVAGRDSDDSTDTGAEADIERLLAEADRDLLSTQGKGPVVKLVDALLFEALGRRASDVHIQPLEDRALVRYRLDGVLVVRRKGQLRIFGVFGFCF